MKPNFHIPGEDLVPAIQSLEGYFRDGGASLVQAAFQHTYFVHPDAVLNQTPLFPERARLSRASTKHTSGAEQKCTTREVIGQRKCPRQLFGRSVTEAGWQQAGRVSE